MHRRGPQQLNLLTAFEVQSVSTEGWYRDGGAGESHERPYPVIKLAR